MSVTGLNERDGYNHNSKLLLRGLTRQSTAPTGQRLRSIELWMPQASSGSRRGAVPRDGNPRTGHDNWKCRRRTYSSTAFAKPDSIGSSQGMMIRATFRFASVHWPPPAVSHATRPKASRDAAKPCRCRRVSRGHPTAPGAAAGALEKIPLTCYGACFRRATLRSSERDHHGRSR
jgi:hypothetical protein